MPRCCLTCRRSCVARPSIPRCRRVRWCMCLCATSETLPMNPFPLVEIILWLALFFAPDDTVEIMLTTAEAEGPMVRTERGWSRGDSEFWVKDDMVYLRQRGHVHHETLTAYIYPVLTHDWTGSEVLALSETSTFEMKPDGFVMRINIGD